MKFKSQKHLDVFESLKLDLKIAADGMPELRKLPSHELCIKFYPKRGRPHPIYTAASAVYAHELYFGRMMPDCRSPSLPQGKSEEILCRSFGSTDNFFYLVRTLASGTRDPGFLWLYAKPSRRKTDIGLARLPLYTLPDLSRFTPLMCIDLWEHAYMEDFGENTALYADSYLRNLNWMEIFVNIP